MQTKKTIKKQKIPKQDKNGNVYKKLWIKDGTTTMLFTTGLTEGGCKALIHMINTALRNLGAKTFPNNKFLITN